jgi:hypothetical protein
MATTSSTILTNLLRDRKYVRRVLPLLKPEYFLDDPDERTVFNAIVDFLAKYKRLPRLTDLAKRIDPIVLDAVFNGHVCSKTTLPQEAFEGGLSFCRYSAIFFALTLAMRIYRREEKNLTVRDIPGILSDALSVGVVEDKDPNVEYDGRFCHNSHELLDIISTLDQSKMKEYEIAHPTCSKPLDFILKLTKRAKKYPRVWMSPKQDQWFADLVTAYSIDNEDPTNEPDNEELMSTL